MTNSTYTTTLHYGGQAFDLEGDHSDILDGYNGEPGTISMQIGDGKQLTVAVGNGIPIAVIKEPTPQPRQSKVRVLR